MVATLPPIGWLEVHPENLLANPHAAAVETEFLSELVRRTVCRLLCDVSNVVVSAHNMSYSAYRYIDDFPADAIAEIHLGGYTPEEDEATADGELWIDTHAAVIAAPSWDL